MLLYLITKLYVFQETEQVHQQDKLHLENLHDKQVSSFRGCVCVCVCVCVCGLLQRVSEVSVSVLPFACAASTEITAHSS